MKSEKDDTKQTRKRLLEHAKAEFSEKGFMKASLRTICKNAGVTTGALYFFFKDKEDLFASLVQEPMQNVNAILLMHYQNQKAQVSEEGFDPTDDSSSRRTCEQILHELFAHRDEFLLLLTKAQGSNLEHVEESFAMIECRQHRILADAITTRLGIEPISDELINWLSHMYVDVFIYILIQTHTLDEALQYLNQIFPYLRNGWLGIFQNKQYLKKKRK